MFFSVHVLCISTKKTLSSANGSPLPQPSSVCVLNKPDASMSFSHFSPFLCCGCCWSGNPHHFAQVSCQGSREQGFPARALLSPGYLRCAGTDQAVMNTACCHLPPLPCHAVSPLDLKMIKLFSCGAYSANTPICIIQAECHCIFSLCFCTSLFQPIYFLCDFHLFPTSNLK